MSYAQDPSMGRAVSSGNFLNGILDQLQGLATGAINQFGVKNGLIQSPLMPLPPTVTQKITAIPYAPDLESQGWAKTNDPRYATDKILGVDQKIWLMGFVGVAMFIAFKK